jgi:hypothetical protein
VGERAFFQIAVALIPVLLFGGVLVERRERRRGSRLGRWEALSVGAIPVLASLAILAEAVAISCVITGRGNVVDRLLVMAVILAGMVAVALSTSIPATRELMEGAASERARQYSRFAPAAVVIAIVVCGLAALPQLTAAIQTSEALADRKRALELQAEAEEIHRRVKAHRVREGDLALEVTELALKGSLTRAERFRLVALQGEQKAEAREARLELDEALRLERRALLVLLG